MLPVFSGMWWIIDHPSLLDAITNSLSDTSTRAMLAIKTAEAPDESRSPPLVWDAIYNPHEKLNGKSKIIPLKVSLCIFLSTFILPCIVWQGRSHTHQANAIVKAQTKQQKSCMHIRKETESSSNWQGLYCRSCKGNFCNDLEQHGCKALSFPRCLVILDFPTCKGICSLCF